VAQSPFGIGIGGVAASADGELYFTDIINHRICRVVGENGFEVLAGGRRGHRNGQGTKAKFDQPKAMECRSDGSLLIADTGNKRVRLVSPGGRVEAFWGGRPKTVKSSLALAWYTAAPAGGIRGSSNCDLMKRPKWS
jgi:hypothetical protein